MTNTISEYFTDEDLEQNLRCQFEYEEMFDIDFRTVFSQITEVDEDNLELKLRSRTFHIDRITGAISEVE